MSQIFPGVDVFAEIDLRTTEEIEDWSDPREMFTARKPSLEEQESFFSHEKKIRS